MATVALITGGSDGIGRTIALRLAQAGYDTVLAARQREQLEAVAESVRGLGRSAVAVPTDVRDPAQVQALVQAGLSQFGQIDVLINNAGIYASGPVEAFSLEDWHTIIDTNLWGYIHTIHALLPHFLERKAGKIINISSIGGKVPVPYLTVYNTSKFAVTGLTESLHSELRSQGIQVSGIYPNLIRSNFIDRAIFRGTDAADQQGRRQQLEKVVSIPVVEKPEDVAAAVWEAIAHQKSEVLVGSAQSYQIAYRLFPGLMQWLFHQGLKDGRVSIPG